YMPAESLTSAFARLTMSPVKQFGRTVNRRVRQVLRRRGGPTVVGAGGIASAAAFGTARARVGWGPLPSIEDDPQGFAAEVHNRLQRLHNQTQDANESIADERTERERALSGLDRQISGRVSALESQTKSIATDGVVEQIFGWIFIVAGVILGTVGNVLQTL
ncbi:MAG TPA: hypothetical protein VGA47_01300, partial [Candidatus Dormibacteraeota bacterium]